MKIRFTRTITQTVIKTEQVEAEIDSCTVGTLVDILANIPVDAGTITPLSEEVYDVDVTIVDEEDIELL